MNKQRKTSHILNVFQYDADGHVGLPASLTLGIAPTGEDNSGKVPTTAWVRSIVGGAVTAYAPTSRTITINGTSYDLSSNRAWSIDTGIMTATAGSGISVSTVSGNLNIVNTGLLTATAGAGISVSTVSQNLNIVNTGLLTATAGSGITVSVVGQNLNVVNTGILTATAGSGISLSVVGQNLNVVNTGILTATAGAGISVSVVNGNLNVVNTITNNNQLTNGAGYITSSALTGYATETYVGTAISNLVDAAPGTLDTLNELAAALGDDPNFATTVSTSIGTRVPQSRTLTINGISFDLSANRSWTINSMIYPSAGIALSTGTAWGTSITDNSANWNTAYGWGNHASAGYLTTASAASTYVSLTGSYANPSWITSLAYSKITGVPAFLTSYTETDTLASVTGRGASTSATISAANFQNAYQVLSLNNIKVPGLYNYDGGISGTQPLGTEWYNVRTIEVGASARYSQFVMPYSATRIFYRISTDAGFQPYVELYHSGNLTNLNQLTNGPGYITGITSSQVTTALGFTPYNSTNPNGYISSYTETSTLANVTSRGATTSTETTYYGGLRTRKSQTAGNYTTAALWTESYDNTATGIAFHISGVKGTFLEMRTNQVLYWDGNTVYHSGNLTNLNQLSNGPGYITSSALSSYLPLSGGTMSGTLTLSSISGTDQTVENTFGAYLHLGAWGVARTATNAVLVNTAYRADYATDLFDMNISRFTNNSGYITSSGSISGNAATVTINYNDNSNASYQLLWGSGNNVYGTGDVWVNPNSDIINARGGFISTSNPWGTSNSAFFPNGITTAGGTNWIYGSTTYIGNAPANGAGHEFYSSGSSYSTGNIETIGSMRAPIFYDRNDTTYYGDFASTSRIRSLNMGYVGGQVYLNSDGGTLFFNANGESDIQGYSIGTTMENYGGNYTKLTIDWHTGIKIGAASGYGGIRFYNNSVKYYSGSQVFSVAEGDNNVRVSNTLFVNGDVRSPIYYDSNDTAYYLNPAGGSRLRNLYVGDSGDDWSDPGGWGTQVRFSNGPHVRFVLHARSPGIEAGMYVHTPDQVYIGSYTSHNVNLMRAGSRRLLIEDGRIYSDVYVEAAGSMRAPIFYDSNDTGYYVDPNGTSNLQTWTADTAARLGRSRYWTNRWAIYGGINDHMTGTNGWGMDHGGWDTAWKGGFSGWDIWGTGTGHPQGGGYIHAQGIISGQHAASSDGSSAYGWMMVGAHNATENRYWLRGKWSTSTSGWVEMITTGNIGSQSVNYATQAGTASNANTVGSIGAGAFFRDLGFEGGGANANTIAETRSAFTYSVGAPHTGPLAYFGASGYGLQINATYHGGDQNISYRVRNGDAGAWKSWYSFITSANIGSQTVSNSDMVDGYHASNFLGYNGNSYYQVNTWLQMNGTHGIYWPSYYGSHLYVNTTTTYTQFRMDGSKNGYDGIWLSYSSVNGMMYDSAGNGGVYREANGRWYWYHHIGNNCTGISTSTTSSSYRAYIGGSLYAEGDVVAYSDVRKKTDIITIDNALEKVTNLRGVFYTRIDDPQRGRQTGVIAQEINEVLPEVVTYAADVDEYGVSYGNIVGVLIEAIKEQQKQIEDLTNKINLLTQNK